MNGPVRGHLRLIIGEGREIAVEQPRMRSAASLRAAIVDAAYAWAALAMQSSEAIDLKTEEGRLRMNVIDAVHDAEYFDSNLVARPELNLFTENPPG